MSSDRITRHRLADRLFHWAMAASMLTLVGTGLCPILGIEFEWIDIHWIAGLVLTVVVVWHIVRAVLQQDLMSMWLGPVELIKAVAAAAKGAEPKPGKYSVAQRLMHHMVTVLCLAALVTGLLLMFRIEQPLWERDPYVLAQSTWGWVYVIHGLAAVVFVSVILLHVYFALRPEKLFYTRSMILGWITRQELNDNHDPSRWPEASQGAERTDS
jgi:formate dehydrogenase subunit gamma